MQCCGPCFKMVVLNEAVKHFFTYVWLNSKQENEGGYKTQTQKQRRRVLSQIFLILSRFMFLLRKFEVHGHAEFCNDFNTFLAEYLLWILTYHQLKQRIPISKYYA